MSGLRRDVLRAYALLLRTQRAVFRDDTHARTVARDATRARFEKNRSVTGDSEIARLIKQAQLTAEFVRNNVVQAEVRSSDRVHLNLENRHYETGPLISAAKSTSSS